MSETTGLSETATVTGTKRPFGREVFVGLVGGVVGSSLVIGVLLLYGTFSGGVFLLTHGHFFRDEPLTVYLILNPTILAVVTWWFLRSPFPRSWRRRATPFFAAGPLSDEEAEARGRRIRKSLLRGFGAGIGVAFVATALDLPWRGWPYVFDTLILALLLCPYYGLLIGYIVGLRPGDPRPSPSDFRFRLRTVMLLVAYVALLFGLGTQALRVSRIARSFRAKALAAESQLALFRKTRDVWMVEARQRVRNIRKLRSGVIPESLNDKARDRLKSLDATATPEDRKRGYDLAVDVEERLVRSDDLFSGWNARFIDYYRALAAKYRKAERQPWVPVAPDPPMPQ